MKRILTVMIVGILCLSTFSTLVSAQAGPFISSVSPITATQLQTIEIDGSGFGNTWPQTVTLSDGSVDTVYSSTTSSMEIADEGGGSHSWPAGYSLGPFQSPLGIYLLSWSDNEIILGGFGTVLGTNEQGRINIVAGDPLTVWVFTPSGYAVYHTTVAGSPPEPTYSVTFTESGLAQGTQWSVTFNGQPPQSSTSNSITFSVPNGVYPFSITSPTGYAASPWCGSINVNGVEVTQLITFAAAPDVAVTNVVASETPVVVGESVPVYVTVSNLGIQSETFSVTGYYGTGEVGFDTATVTLDAGASQILNMIWNTTNVFPGTYPIGAYATLAGDSNPSNNDFQDGNVVVEGLPDEPQNVTAEPMNNAINISWSAPSHRTDVTEYEVFRGTSPDFVATWPPYNSTNNLYFEDSISDDTIYYYRISADYSEGISTPSDAVACARLESLKGISSTVTGVQTLGARPQPTLLPTFTIQQNFYLLDKDTKGDRIVYWCQNVVVLNVIPKLSALPGNYAQVQVYSCNSEGGDKKSIDNYFTGYSNVYPDIIDFESEIRGSSLHMTNSLGSCTVNLGLTGNAYIAPYELSPTLTVDDPNLVIVGPPDGGITDFYAGNGHVVCQTRIGDEWIAAANVKVVPHGAATQEKSTGLGWPLDSNGKPTGEFKYPAGEDDEGIFFQPDFGSLIAQAPSIQNLGQPVSVITFHAKCPVFIDLCDELGRCTGYNVTSGTVETQIDAAVWESNQTIMVFNPSGQYSVIVTGMENGTYSLETLLQKETGSTSIISNSTNAIVENATQVFALNVYNLAVSWGLTSKTIIGQDYDLSVNVATANLGQFSATCNVTLCANTTAIDAQTVNGLLNGTSATLGFTWNTTGFAYGNYILGIIIQPIPDGINIGGNNFTDLVTVTIPGDVDGNFKVNMGDISSICDGFGSTIGPDGNYWHKPACVLCPHSPNLDVNGDGRINMDDIVTALNNFGQHYP